MSGYPDIKTTNLTSSDLPWKSLQAHSNLHQNHAEKDFGTLQYAIVHTLVKTAPLKILQPTVSSQ